MCNCCNVDNLFWDDTVLFHPYADDDVFTFCATRLSAAWNLRKAELAEAVRDQLQEKDLKTRKAVAEVHLLHFHEHWGFFSRLHLDELLWVEMTQSFIIKANDTL